MEKIYSCQNHVNHALDIFIEEIKNFPILDRLKDYEKVTKKCYYCEEQAEYVVSRK